MSKPKMIVIKCDEHSAFLRTEAISKAEYFEQNYAPTYKNGIYNGVMWLKHSNNGKSTWQIYAYQTKTTIVVDVRLSKNILK